MNLPRTSEDLTVRNFIIAFLGASLSLIALLLLAALVMA